MSIKLDEACINRLSVNKTETPNTDYDFYVNGTAAISNNLSVLGTINSGTWNGSTIAVAYGGTGISTIDPHKILIGPSTGSASAAPTWRTIEAADLPIASTNALGIVKAGNGINIDSNGTISVSIQNDPNVSYVETNNGQAYALTIIDSPTTNSLTFLRFDKTTGEYQGRLGDIFAKGEINTISNKFITNLGFSQRSFSSSTKQPTLYTDTFWLPETEEDKVNSDTYEILTTKTTTSIGSENNPVFFNDQGQPQACGDETATSTKKLEAISAAGKIGFYSNGTSTIGITITTKDNITSYPIRLSSTTNSNAQIGVYKQVNIRQNLVIWPEASTPTIGEIGFYRSNNTVNITNGTRTWGSGTFGRIGYDAPYSETLNNTTTSYNNNRFTFKQYSYSNYAANSYYDIFRLPSTSGNTENHAYSILTSKYAVTIGQGGTGATTAENARANLGTWSLINDTYNTLMPADGTTNGWVKIGTANTSYGLLPSQSGNVGSGHNYLGANDWYWSAAFIDTVHGNLDGNAATATADENGYSLSDHYAKKYVQIVDLTNLSTNTWYPVSVIVPQDGMHRISCVTQLEGEGQPSWASHEAGFTAVVEMLVLAGGWGTTDANTICLCNDQKFINTNEQVPIGYSQFVNSSRAAFWCRGGAKYHLLTDFFQGWSIHTESYTFSKQTIAPTTTYPGFNFIYSRITANLDGNAATASKLTDITASDAMTSTNTWRRIWTSYNDNITGRPAYSDNFAYQSSTGTIKVGRISCWPSNGNYNEGLRIHASPLGYCCITLCGTENTGDTGTSANTWAIGTNGGNFSITRNGARVAGTGATYLQCMNDVWEWSGIANGSISGNAYSATTLAIDNTANRASCLQFMQRTDGVDSPSATWYQIIKMNHMTGDTYYKRTLAFEFWTHNIWTNFAAGDGNYSTWKKVWVEGNSVTSAVWNDYAEYRTSNCIEPGYCVFENGDDTLSKTTKRLQHFAGIVSDTWGFSQGETDTAKTPIAVAGRVLAYPYRNKDEYKPGDPLCAAPNGTVDIMTREEVRDYPDRIVGTVSCVPDYEEWGGGPGADREPVKVDGRIWVKVK